MFDCQRCERERKRKVWWLRWKGIEAKKLKSEMIYCKPRPWRSNFSLSCSNKARIEIKSCEESFPRDNFSESAQIGLALLVLSELCKNMFFFGTSVLWCTLGKYSYTMAVLSILFLFLIQLRLTLPNLSMIPFPNLT